MEDEGGDEGFVGEVDLREGVVEASEGVQCAAVAQPSASPPGPIY